MNFSAPTVIFALACAILGWALVDWLRAAHRRRVKRERDWLAFRAKNFNAEFEARNAVRLKPKCDCSGSPEDHAAGYCYHDDPTNPKNAALSSHQTEARDV